MHHGIMGHQIRQKSARSAIFTSRKIMILVFLGPGPRTKTQLKKPWEIREDRGVDGIRSIDPWMWTLLDRWMDGCLAMMIWSSILQRHQSLVGQIFNLILGEDQLPVLSIDPLIHGLPEVQGRVPWKCSPMTMSLEDPVDNCVPGCLVWWMNMV